MTTYGFGERDKDTLLRIIDAAGGGADPERFGIPLAPVLPLRESAVFQSPSNGIAARSNTTLGSASCDLYVIDNGTLVAARDYQTNSTISADVYNLFSNAVGNSVYIVASRIDGHWVVTSEDCP